MCGIRRSTVLSLVVVNALALTSLDAEYSHQRSVNEPPGHERIHTPGADPCDHLPDPPGHAYGIDKKCRRGGSSSGVAKGDFNGDGFADLAVGVPDEESPSGVPGSGAVNIIYGSPDGLVAPLTEGTIPLSQFWSQNSSGVPGVSERDDGFGSSLAAGEFNGDDFSDLAIGVPYEDVTVSGFFGPTTYKNAGGVVVIYGSAAGLATSGTGVPPAKFFEFSDGGRSDKPQDFSHLGTSLAWGDFNGDDIGDLAIGAPDFDTFPFLGYNAGAVWVLFGSQNNGLTTIGNQFWTQEDTGTQESEAFDYFGLTLAAGDFDADGASDLAIGAPGEDQELPLILNTFVDAGSVIVLYGSTNDGLTADRTEEWSQLNLTNIDGSHRLIGAGLAAGDFNGDGHADLAIGAPGEARVYVNGSPAEGNASGAVYVIHGSASGMTKTFQHWTQTGMGIGTTETGDQFGGVMAAGDFNGDGRADLAIGVPREDFTFGGSSLSDAGEVDVIYGSASGLDIVAHAPQLLRQSTTDIAGEPQAGDQFGYSLTAWNFGRNEIQQIRGFPIIRRTADLAIGVPFETAGGDSEAGAVNVIYGSFIGNGLVTTGNRLWAQSSPGVPGGAEPGDHFGRAVY